MIKDRSASSTRAPAPPETLRPCETLGPVTHRVTLLDVLRGFALFGILLINISVLSGSAFMSPQQTAALPGGRADPYVAFLLTAGIEGKFYCLFSLLFGVGAAVILSRAEQHNRNPVKPLTRRYLGLLAIGLVHAILIWHGDIRHSPTTCSRASSAYCCSTASAAACSNT